MHRVVYAGYAQDGRDNMVNCVRLESPLRKTSKCGTFSSYALYKQTYINKKIKCINQNYILQAKHPLIIIMDSVLDEFPENILGEPNRKIAWIYALRDAFMCIDADNSDQVKYVLSGFDPLDRAKMKPHKRMILAGSDPIDRTNMKILIEVFNHKFNKDARTFYDVLDFMEPAALRPFIMDIADRSLRQTRQGIWTRSLFPTMFGPPRKDIDMNTWSSQWRSTLCRLSTPEDLSRLHDAWKAIDFSLLARHETIKDTQKIRSLCLHFKEPITVNFYGMQKPLRIPRGHLEYRRFDSTLSFVRTLRPKVHIDLVRVTNNETTLGNVDLEDERDALAFMLAIQDSSVPTEIMFMTLGRIGKICIHCGGALTKPESIERGFGDMCVVSIKDDIEILEASRLMSQALVSRAPDISKARELTTLRLISACLARLPRNSPFIEGLREIINDGVGNDVKVNDDTVKKILTYTSLKLPGSTDEEILKAFDDLDALVLYGAPSGVGDSIASDLIRAAKLGDLLALDISPVGQWVHNLRAADALLPWA